MPFAESSVAVPGVGVTAHLYEEEIFIDVLAVIQACCKPVLQSSPEHWGMPFAESSVAVPSGVGSLHTCMKSKSS